MRRPVFPVAPRTRMGFGWVMPSMESQLDETVHGQNSPIHHRSSTLVSMDSVAAHLDGPRARGAFVLRSTLAPPWSLRIEDEAPLTVAAAVGGDAWIVRGGDLTRLVR